MYPPKATHHHSSSLIFWPPATIAHLAATVGLPPNLSPHIPSGSSSTFPYAGYSYFYCCAGTKCAPRQRLGRTQKLQRVQNTPILFLFSSFFPHDSFPTVTFYSTLFSIFCHFLGDLEGFEHFSFLAQSSRARSSGWIPKTCNYA
jgi:hypothetical protein